MTANAGRIAGRAAVLAAAVALLFAAPAGADTMVDWTERAHKVVIEQRDSPLCRARTLAILHTTMFQVIDAVERAGAESKVSLEAATATAAHDVLVALYPDRAADLSPALSRSLAGVANTVDKARGFALGRSAASAVLGRWLGASANRNLIGEARP